MSAFLNSAPAHPRLKDAGVQVDGKLSEFEGRIKAAMLLLLECALLLAIGCKSSEGKAVARKELLVLDSKGTC